jgi:hypothetical protein
MDLAQPMQFGVVQGAIMAHTKPILTMSSIGLGVALLLVAINIQRDRFAFTAQNERNSHALTSATFELAVPSPKTSRPLLSDPIPGVAIEVLEVLPAMPRKARASKPATSMGETAPVVCNPTWRELESGPSGRKVREIC